MRPILAALTALLLGGSPALAQEDAAAIDYMTPTTREVAPGVYVFGNYAHRSMFVVTGDGVIATDPTDAQTAAAMRAAIAEVTDQPVKYVVYSHQHWDHIAGGQVFKDKGATFVAHEKCIPHFTRRPNPAVVMPDMTIASDRALTLGDRTLNLMYFGDNHGDCMLVMQVAGTDVLFVSDLVTPYSIGLGSMPDYDPGEWLRTLREIEAMNGWARFVGAHGPAIAPKEALVQRRRYLEALMAAVKAKIDEGLAFEELYDSIELDEEFRALNYYDAQIRRAAERIFLWYDMGW